MQIKVGHNMILLSVNIPSVYISPFRQNGQSFIVLEDEPKNRFNSFFRKFFIYQQIVPSRIRLSVEKVLDYQ